MRNSRAKEHDLRRATEIADECLCTLCWDVLRNDGATLRQALVAGQSARVMLLEGWTNIAESAGFYRSESWTYPNQYINIVREFADPESRTRGSRWP